MHGANNKKEVLMNYVLENQEKFYRLIFYYVKDNEKTLDLLQDAIVKSLSNLDDVKEEQYIKTWFYRIVINECLQSLKKDKVRKVFNIEDYDVDVQDSNIEESVDVYKAIDKLNPKLKTIILLRFFEDKTLEEIAFITKTNLSTVKSRLYKALKILKIDIKEGEVYEKNG